MLNEQYLSTEPGATALVAIDGKTARRSNDKNIGKRALHIVSAYATENRICLGQYTWMLKAISLLIRGVTR